MVLQYLDLSLAYGLKQDGNQFIKFVYASWLKAEVACASISHSGK